MAHPFVEIAPTALGDNVFQAIGRDAMLITAGTPDRFNTMTASWGGWGHLWGRDVTFSFVRPQRHTFGFMEQAEHYTLCFFDQGAPGSPGLLRQPLGPRRGQDRGHRADPRSR